MDECVLEIDPESTTLNRAIRASRARADAARPDGLHLSTIVEDMFKTLKTYGPMATSQQIGYQEVGNAVEDMFAAEFVRKFTHSWYKPKPKKYHGVWCSPDGFDGATLDEMKATWVSSKDFLTTDDRGRILKRSLKWLRYEWQILSYMKAFDVQRARLHVWFIGGRFGYAPEWPRTFRMKYSQRRIDENWTRIIQHAKDRNLL